MAASAPIMPLPFLYFLTSAPCALAVSSASFISTMLCRAFL